MFTEEIFANSQVIKVKHSYRKALVLLVNKLSLALIKKFNQSPKSFEQIASLLHKFVPTHFCLITVGLSTYITEMSNLVY